MFNWLNNTFHKHHKILLGFLLFVMAASFVLYGFVGQNNAGPKVKKRVEYGVDLSNPLETRPACDLAAYISMLRGEGRSTQAYADVITAVLSGGEKEQASPAYSDVLHIVEQLKSADAAGIPAPDDKAIQQFIETFPPFQKDGKFSPETLRQVTLIARENAGLDEARLQGAMANLWRIRKFGEVLLPASAPDLDILAARRVTKNNAKWKIETASFSYDSFKLKADPSEKALSEYFEKNKATYRIAEKLRVSVIKSAGVPAAAPTVIADRELAGTAQLHVADFPEMRQITTQEQYLQFLKDNRTKLIGFMVADRAGEEAALKLSRTLNAVLPRTGGKPGDVKIAETLKAAGLKATSLPPYSGQEPATGTGIPDGILAGALQLTETNWRTEVSAAGSTAYAFILDGTIPARDATFTEVRAKVIADYKAEETRTRFNESARTKAAAIAAAVKAGKPFADAATAAGFTPKPEIEFVYAQAPSQFDANTLSLLENRPVGAVSDIIRDFDGVFIAHVISRVEQPPKKDAGELAVERSKLGTEAAQATYLSIRDTKN